MDELEVTIERWGAGHAELVDALVGARILSAAAREEQRAGALYDALGIVPHDERYRLLELRDGRWGLFGVPREGERFALESVSPREPLKWRAR